MAGKSFGSVRLMLVAQLFSIMGDEQGTSRPNDARVIHCDLVAERDEQGTKEQSSQTIGLNFYLELSRQFFFSSIS